MEDPRRQDPVFHEGLPLAAPRTTVCPMRAYQDPAAQRALVLYRRVRLWGVLPRAGGLYDQDLGDLVRLELIAGVYQVPWRPRPARQGVLAGRQGGASGPGGGPPAPPLAPALPEGHGGR